MRIQKMTATFGCLDHATLIPGSGLTLIHAPNESGKSTWAAFLRAMFYGFPARDRDSKGYIAEKNRYQPWSGAAMEGSITLEWQGREMTLYRGAKGTTPWGTFRAVWSNTQEPVDGLTAENCGETLLGVSREVFERTAFVGQGQVFLSPSGDLEKRVSALATTGEEDVSFSQVERRLKDWLNRRKVNARVGLIPELEGELAETDAALTRQGSLLRQAREAAQEKEVLEQRKACLEAELQTHADAQNAAQAQRWKEAQADCDTARHVLESARQAVLSLPSDEELRQAQGNLHYLNTIEANLREAEAALPTAKEKLAQSTAAAATDPLFGGKTPEQAHDQTRTDYNRVLELQRPRPLWLLLLLPFAITAFSLLYYGFFSASGWFCALPWVAGSAVIALVLAVILIFLHRKQEEQIAIILTRYHTHTSEDILKRASEYGDKVSAVQECQREMAAIEVERNKLLSQKEELTTGLLALVHPFAPEVTDMFGVSAALSRALAQGERYRDAQTRLTAAEKLLSALPTPRSEPQPMSIAPPQSDPVELNAQLGAVVRELARISDSAARLDGELRAIGDPTELTARHDTLTEAVALRREEYAALTAALESLKNADSLLRERFSPALNGQAGQYLNALTGGKYTQTALTRQFQATAQEPGSGISRPDLVLSGGTAQQLYLAARLAMCDLALPQSEIPIVLDDALDAFDDQRTRLALEVLLDVAKNRQVLLFTCHNREETMLAGKPATFLSIT